MRWPRGSAHKHEKFFAAYLTEFPHHPYLTMAAKPPFPNDTWLNRYKNSLHYADSAVGRLVEVLKSEGLLEKTVIAVVGDHGETVSHYPVGHGLRVSVEEMRPPLILSNPKLFPGAAESTINSDHLDIAPTLARLVGLSAPADWLGRDLLADRIADRLHFVTITQIDRTAVIDGDLLYVLDRGRGKSGAARDRGDRVDAARASRSARRIAGALPQRGSPLHRLGHLASPRPRRRAEIRRGSIETAAAPPPAKPAAQAIPPTLVAQPAD